MDRKRRNSLLIQYLMVFVIATVTGLLYNRYKSGAQTSVVAVCGFAFMAATTAMGCRMLAERYFSRR